MTKEEKCKIAQEGYELGKLKRRNVENPEEEDVESLCKLLNTTGSRMDHKQAKKQFDAYFARIEELSNNKKLAARIRFMLRDLIDLRKDGWANRNAPARPRTGPMTIAQIRAEAERMAAEDAASGL
ncbi:hypothetical protein DFS34DRAFT_660374 [Phlyctochytrium arcticum]|nr:hypothetical protein DFS34DRAFT_660374 [Phlyctochytrium arcticum]